MPCSSICRTPWRRFPVPASPHRKSVSANKLRSLASAKTRAIPMRRKCRLRCSSIRRSPPCPTPWRRGGKDACRCLGCADWCRVTRAFATRVWTNMESRSSAKRKPSMLALCNTNAITCSGFFTRCAYATCASSVSPMCCSRTRTGARTTSVVCCRPTEAAAKSRLQAVGKVGAEDLHFDGIVEHVAAHNKHVLGAFAQGNDFGVMQAYPVFDEDAGDDREQPRPVAADDGKHPVHPLVVAPHAHFRLDREVLEMPRYPPAYRLLKGRPGAQSCSQFEFDKCQQIPVVARLLRLVENLKTVQGIAVQSRIDLGIHDVVVHALEEPADAREQGFLIRGG